jgi:hypothetical protein
MKWFLIVTALYGAPEGRLEGVYPSAAQCKMAAQLVEASLLSEHGGDPTKNPQVIGCYAVDLKQSIESIPGRSPDFRPAVPKS